MFGKFLPRLLSREEMTPKRDYTAGMDEIQQPLALYLKGQGFRRQGRTHNRTTADGLVHVINFQMGAYPLGGHEIEGLRENVWGKFTVNLGVVIPRLYAMRFGSKVQKKFYRESDGGLSLRLGHLAEKHDVWWPIEPPFAQVAATIQIQLEQFARPFFERFPDHRSVVTWAEAHLSGPGIPGAVSPIAAAVAAHQCGDSTRAAFFFTRARNLAHAQKHPGTRDAQLAHIEKIEGLSSAAQSQTAS